MLKIKAKAIGGYYSGTDGTGTQYYTASGASARTWNKTTSTATLYAKWVKKTVLESQAFDYAAFFAASQASVDELVSYANYVNNELFDPDVESRVYLVNQNDASFYGSLLYGAGFAHNTVGCELIAMYNALKLTGHPVSYSRLTYQTEITPGAQMGYGGFGTNPYKLDTIMRTYGATVTKYSSAEEVGFDEFTQVVHQNVKEFLAAVEKKDNRFLANEGIKKLQNYVKE